MIDRSTGHRPRLKAFAKMAAIWLVATIGFIAISEGIDLPSNNGVNLAWGCSALLAALLMFRAWR